MASRRMFAKTIIDSDAFLEMPATTQLLYFHLSMRADDDGFVNKPKAIMRTTGTKDDDISLLIAKKFIIPFESGVIVIKHWKIHNYIQKDRYTETKYKNEKAMLSLDENKSYTLTNTIENTECIQNGYEVDTQVRLELGKSKESNILLVKEIIDYLNLKANTQYRANSEATKRLINARMNEAHTVEDFKKVIDIKTDEWLGTDYAKYLRPNTLFSTKFEGYLNQPIKKQKEVKPLDKSKGVWG